MQKVKGQVGLYIKHLSNGDRSYYFTYKRSGYQFAGRASSGTSISTARQMRNRFIKDSHSAIEVNGGVINTFGQLFNLYIGGKHNSTSRHDVSVYKTYLKDPLENQPLNRLSRPQIDDLIGGYTEISPSTKNRILGTLRRVFKYYISCGAKIKNPVTGIKVQTMPFQKDRVLSRAEIKKMVELCDANGWAELKAQILLGVEMGLRRGEVRSDATHSEKRGYDLSICWENISGDQIRFIRKGRKYQTMKLTPNVKKALSELPRDGRFVFSKFQLEQFNTVVNTLGLNNGLDYNKRKDREKWVSFHTLRHTFGSIVLRQTKSLHMTAMAMNHSYQQTTLIYSHMLKEDKDNIVEQVASFFEEDKNGRNS